MTLEPTDDEQRPTRTSTIVVVLAGVAAATALVDAANVVWPAAVGATGAVTLAVVVWAAGWSRHRTAGTVLASLLVLPVGVGIVTTTVGTVLVLAGSLFPVPTAADIPETVVRLTARAMVVTGAVATVFGAATAIRGVLDRETVERAATTGVRTAVFPALVAAGLAASAALAELERTGGGSGVGSQVGTVLRSFTGAFLRPEPFGPHLPTFVLLAGVGLMATQRAVRALPITELLAETSDGNEARETVAQAQRLLFGAATLTLMAFPVVALVHVALPPRQLRDALGPGGYEVLLAVTANPGLRTLAWWVTVAGVGVVAVVWLLRRFVQSSADRIGSVLAPFAGGAGVVGLALLVAGDVLRAAVDWVASKLPGVFATQFRTAVGGVVDVYGAGTIVLGGVAVTLVLAVGTIIALWLVLATGYVDERTAGSTVASLALFSTAAFAGVLDVSNALVLGGLVAAVLVWDAGEFGVTLGEEIGRRADTRRAELVHTTGTLAVGGFGAGVAVLVADASFDVGAAGTGPVALGLVAVLGGLILLVLALR